MNNFHTDRLYAELDEAKQALADRTAELEQAKRVANEMAGHIEQLRKLGLIVVRQCSKADRYTAQVENLDDALNHMEHKNG